MCFVAKYSYKILADIRKNLLEAKVCNCFVSSHGNMQWQFLLTVYSLHPNTSEAYKMNTIIFLVFSFRENIYVVSTPKMHFPVVPTQDCFCFLKERSGFRWYLSFYIHELLSQKSQRSCFVCTSIRCNLHFDLSEIHKTFAVEGFYC